MICETCKSEGATSTIEVGPGIVTLMGWSPHYDKGVLHRHDPNIHTRSYTCSRGHRWEVRGKRPCPACAPPNESDGEPK